MTDTPSPCIFCEIVAGRAPAWRVYEDDLTIVILDIHPYTRGHCLALPKRHVPWWHEMTDEENAALFKAAKIVAERMMKAYSPDFVFLYARGRRIPHTHVFLVPTFAGDVLDRFFNALENFQESPRRLAALADPEAMAEALKDLTKG
ncbi:MAG TPA: HIT family protein [Syntrophales bacterium]|nr:HIT family protein [Syntrophales bacterium]HOM06355.1 HIT family protein [Syntrophales bacterium]HON99194.1 HIT family protein [Syntrophales bacterium]HPC00302.1 HIT family protein [Syntrophales bacterium]HPQ05965.1 HIT family protein [Syntrophales bacterium]